MSNLYIAMFYGKDLPDSPTGVTPQQVWLALEKQQGVDREWLRNSGWTVKLMPESLPEPEPKPETVMPTLQEYQQQFDLELIPNPYREHDKDSLVGIWIAVALFIGFVAAALAGLLI